MVSILITYLVVGLFLLWRYEPDVYKRSNLKKEGHLNHIFWKVIKWPIWAQKDPTNK